MSSELKRVGLILTAEGATDFKKTLQEVNLEINKNYNEFKLAQSQWDESTSKIQKLREQQEYLTNAYELQEDKVSALKMQLTDMENAEDKNTQAIKKKRTELLNAEVQLKNYNNRLKNINTDLSNTEKGIKTTTEKIAELTEKTKENENAFKLTQSQYTAMTTKTQKLKDEQKYLSNAYDLQKEKIELLNEQLQELENAEDKNSIAISKKKQEILKAETELNNYNTKLKIVTNQLEKNGAKAIEFGKNIEKVGNKIEGAGKKLSAFSAATGAALVGCAKSAIDFEDAFTGVEKTVDGTEEQMAELKQGIRDMAKEIPSTTTEISAVAEAAGQLGIKTEDILSFTRVMIDLGNSTNVSAEEAASSLAKFANVTKMSAKDYDKLGSTIVALGNNFQTTEADIIEMAQNLASTGTQVGMSQSDIMALATALSSVGLEAQAGGTAFSKALTKMQLAVETNSDSLKDWADVAGMSVNEFADLFKKDATKALEAFIKGLSECGGETESAIKVLDEMGITETRMRDALLRSANASEVFTKAIELGSEAWEDNTALTNEANKRYETLKSKITIAMNKVKDIAITLGNKLMPSIEKIIDKIEDLTNWFANLTDEQVDWIVKIGLTVTAISPLLTIVGKLTSTIGGGIKTLGTFTQAIGVMRGSVTTTDTAVNGLAKVIGSLTNPVGLAVTAIGALAGAYIYVKQEADKLPEGLQKIIEETDKAKQSHEQYREELDKTTSSSLAEIQNSENLRNELSRLVDENGKVKEGYKDRVAFILTELNKALGTEYSLTGDVINQYKTLQDEIDSLVLKKKAQIILENEEGKYSTAMQNKNEAYQKLIDSQEEYNNALKGKTYEEFFEDLKQNYMDAGYTAEASAKYAKEYMAKWIDGYKNAYETNKGIYNDYLNYISKYENDFAISQSNNTEKIKQMTDERINNYARENLSKGEQIQVGIAQELYNIEELKKLYQQDLQNQNEISAEANANAIKSGEERLQNLIENLKSQTSTVNENSPDIIEAWKKMATDSYDVYYDTVSQAPPELSKKIQEMTGVTAERTPELVQETQKMSQQVIDQINKNPEFKSKALDNLRGYLNGLEDSQLRELLKEAGIENADKVIEGIKNGNLAEDQGIQILNSLNTGLQNKNWKQSLFSTARGIASSLSGILTVKANVNGNTSALPGHKLGLDYVPKDNYVARLHKGERVLTKEENEAYTEAENSSARNNSNIVNFGSQIDYDKMANSMLKALTGCKFTLDEDGFAKIVKDELYKVV